MVNKSSRKSLLKILLGITAFTMIVAQVFAQGDLSEKDRPIFPKRKIKIGHHTIAVEVADTDPRRAFGLMFRDSLPKDAGMLFIFDDERERAFWMHNTRIPLSIAYFDKDKVLVEIIDMQPEVLGATRPKTYPSRKKAMFALEMNIGWYERNKIRPGVSFRIADK